MEQITAVELVLSDKILELILLPTEQCNFRCVYCYENFSVGRMESGVINGVKALLNARSPELSILNIQWFGGEPLAAKDIVLDISKFAAELSVKYPSMRYTSSMTTNGFFLNLDVAAALIQAGVKSYQISLDGPPEFHNMTRLRANGDGSYEQIMLNLEALRNSNLDFHITLRIHLTPENLDSIDGFVKELVAKFNDPRFSLFFKEIGHYGGVNDKNIRILKNVEATKAKLRQLVRETCPTMQPKEIADDVICYAARANSFLIRPNGNIGKCTVVIEEDRNVIGKLTEGGKVEINIEKLKPWLRGLASFDFSLMQCPAANWPKLSIAPRIDTLESVGR